jgi:muconolactone delta-isomerase
MSRYCPDLDDVAGNSAQARRDQMKYVMRWNERAYGTAEAYESAQSRILGLMQHWQPPASVTIHQFVVVVGRYGGYAVMETDDVLAIHQMTSTFAVFEFTVEPVVDVAEALGAEAAAIEWRSAI